MQIKVLQVVLLRDCISGPLHLVVLLGQGDVDLTSYQLNGTVGAEKVCDRHGFQVPGVQIGANAHSRDADSLGADFQLEYEGRLERVRDGDLPQI